jgi:hypothetical protein
MIVFDKEELNKLFDSGMKPGVVYTIIDSNNSGYALVTDIYINIITNATKAENINITYYLSEDSEKMSIDGLMSHIIFPDDGCLKSIYFSKDYSNIEIKPFSTDSSDQNVLLCEKPVTYDQLEKLRKDIKDTNSYAIVIISKDVDRPIDTYYSAESLIFVRTKDECIWADSVGSDMYVLHD